MANYDYNMGINEKKTLKLDLKNSTEAINFNFTNDMAGQVRIVRKANSVTITGYATKPAKTTTIHIYAKAEWYKYAHYYHDLDGNRVGEAQSTAGHRVFWGHYEYLDYEGPYGGWGFQPINEYLIPSMKEIDDDNINEYEAARHSSSITYYIGDKNGKNLQEIGKKVFEPGTYYGGELYEPKENPVGGFIFEDMDDYAPVDLTEIQTGTAVVDYTRKHVQITLTNIADYKGAGVVVNTQKGYYNNYNLFDAYEVEGTGKYANKFSGTNFSENFHGTTASDKIYTGGGTDSVDAGKGNDKIYITGKGDKTITINKGDGNDIIYTAQKADSINLEFDTDKLYYSKSGNNLVITRAYNDKSVEGTAIAGFFKKKMTNVYTSDDVDAKDIMSQINDGDIRLTLTGEGKKITGSAYSDEIYAGAKTKTVNGKGGNNILVTDANNKYAMSLSAGNGDDIYYIQNLDKKITISDGGGTSDRIIITDTDYSLDKMFLFYDIKLDKKKDYVTETSLHVLANDKNTAEAIKSRKGKIDDSIVIKNALTKDGDGGKGWIEGIAFYDGNNASFFEADWATLEQSVAGWLTENNYKSAMTAFKNASADKVAELIQIYVNNT
ncbi:MAG: hypothetical protein K6E29_02355 [Cyanobacteria bacterium RUI128]|nr:hypothetical protein [Cyanobacteria bacterium RUI128]